MFGGLFYIIKEIEVDKIIIGKQFENSDNYEEFLKIIKQKNIDVYITEVGERIIIEKNLYFDILWPDKENIINENILNNNSLVCKLIYKNFSILFTGDIEEVAEKAILNKYDKNELKTTILKVAHHGSKTSSMKEFINALSPNIAIIEVGKNNTFGHPSKQVIEDLKKITKKIYRTDNNGEIIVKTNGKIRGKIVNLEITTKL